MKIEMMRKNPNVCFEVESIETMTNWSCVVAWGKFEELDNEVERTKALKILNDRLMPYLLSETMRPHGVGQIPHDVEKGRQAVVYRISITEMTGRYEKNHFGKPASISSLVKSDRVAVIDSFRKLFENLVDSFFYQNFGIIRRIMHVNDRRSPSAPY